MRLKSVICGAVLAMAAQAGVLVSITVAPPVMPVYVQPICPGDGFLWTPGYWAYGDAGYFWVPGVWMRPPTVGLLWTPGYWGWNGGVYAWNAGYWGPHVGFYGGVNYGFGYGGVGFVGGRWEGGHFAYNAEVAHVGAGFHSYHETVVVNNVHTSFNGGSGGLRAQPNGEERRAMGEHHSGPTGEQNSHHEMASHDRSNFASVNHGRPANAAMSRPHTAGGGAGANHGSAANHGSNAGANHGPSANHGSNASASHAPSGGSANHGSSGKASGGGGSQHAAASEHKAPAGGGGSKGGGGGSHGGGGGGSKGGGKK
jgi:hypothetical protein